MPFDPAKFKNMLDRTMAFSQEAEKRAMETGDTSEIDAAFEAMERLKRVGEQSKGIQVEGPVSNTVLRGPLPEPQPEFNSSGMPTDAQWNALPPKSEPDVMRASQGAWRKGQEMLKNQPSEPVENEHLRLPREVDWYKQKPFLPDPVRVEPEPSGMTGKESALQYYLPDNQTPNPEYNEELKQKWKLAQFSLPGERTLPKEPTAEEALDETIAGGNPVGPLKPWSPETPKTEPESAANPEADALKKVIEQLKAQMASTPESSFDQEYQTMLRSLGIEKQDSPLLARLVQGVIDAADIGFNNSRGYAERKATARSRDAQRMQAANMVRMDRASRATKANKLTNATAKAEAEARKFGIRQANIGLRAKARGLEQDIAFLDKRIAAIEFANPTKVGTEAITPLVAPFMQKRDQLHAELQKYQKSALENMSREALDDAITELGLDY